MTQAFDSDNKDALVNRNVIRIAAAAVVLTTLSFAAGVAGEERTEVHRLRLPLPDFFGARGVALQPLLDPLPFPRGQETVDIGVQVVFGDGVEFFRHFGLRMLITLSSFMASANWRRARESRDMTVPIGMAIISATSW